jgi:K+/H+ antiporter YhaU regulatory subunit KhtT
VEKSDAEKLKQYEEDYQFDLDEWERRESRAERAKAIYELRKKAADILKDLKELELSCPNCFSVNISINDQVNQIGLVIGKCNKCGESFPYKPVPVIIVEKPDIGKFTKKLRAHKEKFEVIPMTDAERLATYSKESTPVEYFSTSIEYYDPTKPIEHGKGGDKAKNGQR